MTSGVDFSRQSFLGEGSEEVLRQSRVAIVGLGGGGSHIAQQLAHLGVGHFKLFDPQTIEASNLNRLVTATQADVEAQTPKVDILARTIRGVRPAASVETFQTDWLDCPRELRDVDVVFGCVDSFRGRKNLETACRRSLLPYIDVGMGVKEYAEGKFAISGQVVVSTPDGFCLQCLGIVTEKRLDQEDNQYGDAGHNPQVVWTNGTLASIAVGAFVQMTTPWNGSAGSLTWLALDGTSHEVRRSVRGAPFAVNGSCPHYPPAEVGQADYRKP